MANMVGARCVIEFRIGQESTVTPIQVLNYINLLATREGSEQSFYFIDNLPKNVSPNLNDEIWDSIYDFLREVA